MNPVETSRSDLVTRAQAHAAQCFKNQWAGGDPQMFAEMVELIKRDGGERELIIAQGIAWACHPLSVLVPWVELFEIACRSPHEWVRINAALQARQLSLMMSRMSDENAGKVKAGIELLAKDQNESVRKNLQVSGVVPQP